MFTAVTSAVYRTPQGTWLEIVHNFVKLAKKLQALGHIQFWHNLDV